MKGRNKLELEGKWLPTTLTTLLLSHLGYGVALISIISAGGAWGALSESFIRYLSQGSLIISCISLLASALFRKEEKRIPEQNVKYLSFITKSMYTVTFVQGIFYGVVYDTSQYSINLEKKQLVFSVILYVIAIICLFMFNYFNRTEKSFLDESKEVNNEFTESSKMKVEERDVEFD